MAKKDEPEFTYGTIAVIFVVIVLVGTMISQAPWFFLLLFAGIGFLVYKWVTAWSPSAKVAKRRATPLSFDCGVSEPEFDQIVRDADVDYFAHSYLSMNPLYRTDYATAGPDREVTPFEVAYMCGQEKFDPAFLLNFSVGKSWYIQRKYQLGFSLNAKNLLNNTWVKTGGYEQTRIVKNTVAKEMFYRFDSKYFYMSGFNYMLNIYFRF